ncbi:MAG: ribosome maturation factor RimP [Desulfarculus sp.]|nr:ribosome maturation factor RimP [Pseudomonadota bacterium]MBV1717759.1 ribosome maturation factor RimP [Desulfarculus sp.]MBU4575539.1 ribosome maturation factor RimP [Pseudomonadota bacterium]MBU4596756.1 ribosome maturation factor RimP [Pseudomonadota bacterium]MBV1740475.1 ribosome maturation factor RimP [Desulfarculus sp.]
MEPTAPANEMEKRLGELLEPVVRSEGLMLVELSWRRERAGQVLRLCVDRPEGGVSLTECTELSRQVSDLLDVEEPIEVPYSLEVSSPGLNRKLKDPREFDLFAGRPARLVVSPPGGGTQVVQGVLKGTMGQDVLIEVKGKVKALPVAQVAKAKLDLGF